MSNQDRISISKSALKDVLGSPVAYYSSFAKVAGDVCAGVLVSQFFYWYGRGHDPDGWIYKTQIEIEQETGLTRANQETARKKLRNLGILEEKKEGIPAKLYYRLDVERLFELIEEQSDSSNPSKQGCGNQANSDEEIKQTETLESSKHSIYTETTTKSTSKKKVTPPPVENPPVEAKHVAAQRTTAAPSSNSKNILDAFVKVKQENEPNAVINYGKEGTAAKALSKAGWTDEQVTTCALMLYSEPFYQDKPLSLMTIATQIGAKLKKTPPPIGPAVAPRPAQAHLVDIVDFDAIFGGNNHASH